MGKLAGATFAKLKNANNVTEEVKVQMLDFQKDLESMEFDSKIKGRTLTAWKGALSVSIRFTTKGNTVIIKHGASAQLGHEEKLDLKETYDYVSTKISNYWAKRDD